MKMDFHPRARHVSRLLNAQLALTWGTTALIALITSACGPVKTTSNTYQKASEECASSASSTQFMVRYEDNSFAVVKAASEKAFINGYLKKNLAHIRYAEPDYRVHSATFSKEPRVIAKAKVKAEAEAKTGEEVGAGSVSAASADADNWGVIRVAADHFWQQGFRGQGVVVAVIDSGMDLTHPQLAKQVYTNPGELGSDAKGGDKSSNGIDDDGNGFVDDSQGWDFTVDKPIQGDNAYHGTHVAGIIAAAHQDTTAAPHAYVQGIAPSAKILPLAFLGSDGSGAMSDAVRAIVYAVNRGAKVINASWGGTQCSRSLRDTITALEAQNVIFVAAAGNDSSDLDVYREYPASLNLASQITVGATGEYDIKAEYSNFGDLAVHLFAPGSDIISTIPVSRGGLGSLSGTSMATPFVTGTIALLLSANSSATIKEIRPALYNSAIKRNDYINASRGRMNLANTLGELTRLMQ